jgi:selT/selW/selH-like putative selenoprotein
LAAHLREHLGLETELIKGDRGIFDVRADGDLVFSKHDVGRFPTNDEVLEILKKR